MIEAPGRALRLDRYADRLARHMSEVGAYTERTIRA